MGYVSASFTLVVGLVFSLGGRGDILKALTLSYTPSDFCDVLGCWGCERRKIIVLVDMVVIM